LTVGQNASLTTIDADGQPQESLFVVRGLFGGGVLVYGEGTIFMPLAKAQAFTLTGDRASAVMLLHNRDDADTVAAALAAPELQTLTWREMNARASGVRCRQLARGCWRAAGESPATVGQPASVPIEPLAVTLPGRVARIAAPPSTIGGDVGYAVWIDLDEQLATLRWGDERRGHYRRVREEPELSFNTYSPVASDRAVCVAGLHAPKYPGSGTWRR